MAGGGGSAHFIRYSGPLTPGATNGFSVDTITLHAVPGLSSAILLAPMAALVLRRRRAS